MPGSKKLEEARLIAEKSRRSAPSMPDRCSRRNPWLRLFFVFVKPSGPENPCLKIASALKNCGTGVVMWFSGMDFQGHDGFT